MSLPLRSWTSTLVLAAGVFQSDSRAGDFNGDGFDDLVIGSPGYQVGAVEIAGSVFVIPGASTGPVTAGVIEIGWEDLGVTPAAFAALGRNTCWGDFNGDEFDDLVISASGMTVGDKLFAGQVYVVPGGAAGFDFDGTVRLDQDRKNVIDKAEEDDLFGAEMVVGDFDGDGFDDLAVQTAREEIGGVAFAGSVHVFYGSAKGLRTKGSQFWHQNRTGMKDQCEEDDEFGVNLAAGDLNGDGYDDLAAALVGEQTKSSNSFGRVAVILGSAKGLRSKGNRLVVPVSSGVPIALDVWYAKLAIDCGDFDGDGFDDLAIGVHTSTPNPNVTSQGVVFVAEGGPTGPATSMAVFAAGLNGVPGVGLAEDHFGYALRAGDFDADGDDDLAIYVAGNNAAPSGAGSITVLEGGSNGLIGASATSFHQDTAGIAGVAEAQDQFGLYMSTADYNGDGAFDLTVGVPFEDVSGLTDAGVVHVLFGAGGIGVVTNGSLLLGKNDLPGVESAANTEYFGRSVGR